MKMYRRIMAIMFIMIYYKNLESTSMPTGKPNSIGVTLPDKSKIIPVIPGDSTPDTVVYNLCNLIITNNNGTSSTIFVGNGFRSTTINTQRLRHDLFQALLPYTGTPIFLVRVTVTENDTLKGLVSFDVCPTINGSVIGTGVISSAVDNFCNPGTTTTYKTFNSHLTSTSALKTKINQTNLQIKKIPPFTIGIAVGIPFFLLFLLILLLALCKRKFSQRNKIMTNNGDGIG